MQPALALLPKVDQESLAPLEFRRRLFDRNALDPRFRPSEEIRSTHDGHRDRHLRPEHTYPDPRGRPSPSEQDTAALTAEMSHRVPGSPAVDMRHCFRP